MKKLIAILLALTLLLALTACGKKPQTDSEYIADKGTLVVGITDFAPMDYQENGEWIGFDADMASKFAESLGVKVEFVEIDWDNKANELNAKSIDCVWNGMTLTDGVKAAMSTSNPYCNNAQVVVVPAEVAANYESQDAISGLTFAVEAGSAGEEIVAGLGYEYVSVVDQATALLEVSSGTCDAAVIDLLMAGAMIGEGTSYPDLVTGVELTSEEYGVGFRKDSELIAEFNKFWKEAYDNGTVMKCAETYGIAKNIIAK